MIKVPDVASYAAIHFLDEVLGRKCGGSTGTNLYGAFQIMADMAQNGQSGSVVTLICDSGERYLQTYYNYDWLQNHGYHLEPYLAQLQSFYETGQWS
jgi:cysteine synthase A